jgi:hypothetical protein
MRVAKRTLMSNVAKKYHQQSERSHHQNLAWKKLTLSDQMSRERRPLSQEPKMTMKQLQMK